MTEPPAATASRARSAAETAGSVAAAFRDLLDQEFSFSAGYLAAILNGCLFAPSVLTFWFVNGVVDFSTAIAIGAAGTAGGLQIRLAAYVLLVPTFLLTRAVAHLLHPSHRAEVLAGSCPSSRLLSLDWFSVGILATGLPLAMQNFGPWAGMNVVFLLGVFVVPRVLPAAYRGPSRLVALVGGSTLFLYANYGGAVGMLPRPAAVVGPVATVSLSDAATGQFVTAVNSMAAGPALVAGFGAVMNRIFTRPELADIPVLGHAMPRPRPHRGDERRARNRVLSLRASSGHRWPRSPAVAALAVPLPAGGELFGWSRRGGSRVSVDAEREVQLSDAGGHHHDAGDSRQSVGV